MSSTPTTLTREQWRTVLDDTDLPTFGELVSTIEAATMIDAEGPAAEQLVDGAVGDLLEADPEASGMFDVYCLLDRAGADPDPEDETPSPEAGEAGSSTPETDETDEPSEAFADAVEFFHDQVGADVSAVDAVEFDTPREAFRDGRGWDDETIDEKRLGWAPASDTALLDYLMQRGYDREAILVDRKSVV